MDVSKSKDLAAQFGIDSIPSLFMYRGNKVYRYEGPLVVDSVLEWCQRGYKEQASIPYLESPMGIVGQLKGRFEFIIGCFRDLADSVRNDDILHLQAVQSCARFGGTIQYHTIYVRYDCSVRSCRRDIIVHLFLCVDFCVGACQKRLNTVRFRD